VSFARWSLPPFATISLVLTAAVYFRGWRRIRLTRPAQFQTWRLWCFLGGLFVVWFAIASPLDSLSGLLLVVHMTQHLLLMSVAPPLIVAAAPAVPLLRGLPRMFIREGLGPFLATAPFRGLERLLKSRLFAWIAMNATFLAWHVPAAYDLALRHHAIHEAEHATFLLTSILFWWPILSPWPTVYKGTRWLLLPYLLSADIINTALSAALCFAGRVVYPVYADAPRLFGFSALEDQVAAGALMWVVGSLFFLVPVMVITVQQLSTRRRFAPVASLPRLVVPAKAGPLDLLALPGVGAFLKSRYGRQLLQAGTLVVAAAVILDGFRGHPMAAMNLAGVVPWTYVRALLVLSLLAVGNLFCMVCPFTLPREFSKWLVRKVKLNQLPWPTWLRNKWLSAALLVVFFWAYEAFALWNSPARTAALLVAYFATCFLVDSLFRGASFCKYVCPIGQFNFIASLVSPVELQSRSQQVCADCSTRNCIAGTPEPARPQRGCELNLFMPLKAGGVDCTLCMDCVKACPHDNIGLYVMAPAHELQRAADPQRSSVGRYGDRWDLAALAVILVAGGFASAAVMVQPVADLLANLGQKMPSAPAAGFALAVSIPLVLFAVLALVTKAKPLPRWALALVPLGLAMWGAHLLFHLLTGWETLGPTLLQAARDFRLSAPAPDWAAGRSLVGSGTLLQLQLAVLDCGLLASLYLGWRLAMGGVARRVARLAPWAALVFALYAAGVWILLEPMQMRGMAGM
jgi:cytochrome c oxidase assembly factor CtaG